MPILLFALLLAAPPAQQTVQETIVVQRLVVNLRIVDTQAKPILGLQASDFTVTMLGHPVQVESATWVPETEAGREMAGQPEVDPDFLDALAANPEMPIPENGRLFVFLFQNDFGRARLKTQMAFLPYADKIVRQLPRDDRVAVLTFDSHLRLRLDFTRNHDEIIQAMHRAIEIGDLLPAPPVPEPSLAACLDPEKMRRMNSLEEALLHLSEVLAQLPGNRQIVIFGYGMGEMVGRQLVARSEWDQARERFTNTGVIVNSVYTGIGGQLMAGLKRAAHETGGFFFLNGFKGQIVDNFSKGPLAGHYEIVLSPPPGIAAGSYDTEIRVKTMIFHARLTLE